MGINETEKNLMRLTEIMLQITEIHGHAILNEWNHTGISRLASPHLIWGNVSHSKNLCETTNKILIDAATKDRPKIREG